MVFIIGYLPHRQICGGLRHPGAHCGLSDKCEQSLEAKNCRVHSELTHPQVCYLGDYQVRPPVKQGPHMGGTDEGMFMNLPSPASIMLNWRCQSLPRGPPSQIPTGATLWRLKAPGVAGARTPHHSSVGTLNPPGEGSPREATGVQQMRISRLLLPLPVHVRDQALGTEIHLARR